MNRAWRQRCERSRSLPSKSQGSRPGGAFLVSILNRWETGPCAVPLPGSAASCDFRVGSACVKLVPETPSSGVPPVIMVLRSSRSCPGAEHWLDAVPYIRCCCWDCSSIFSAAAGTVAICTSGMIRSGERWGSLLNKALNRLRLNVLLYFQIGKVMAKPCMINSYTVIANSKYNYPELGNQVGVVFVLTTWKKKSVMNQKNNSRSRL